MQIIGHDTHACTRTLRFSSNFESFASAFVSLQLHLYNYSLLHIYRRIHIELIIYSQINRVACNLTNHYKVILPSCLMIYMKKTALTLYCWIQYVYSSFYASNGQCE